MKYLNNFNYFTHQGLMKEAVDTSIFENYIFNPKNIFETFCSLTQKTYPYGTEEEVLKWIDIPLQKDEYGNYFIKIGESNTMFTSHFDTACSKQNPVNLITFEKDNDRFITTDGKTILGADDKAGVTIMLYMIENKIPGLYYFFIGEERGGIGSIALASNKNHQNLNGIKKCISFDRRGYTSIITHQLFESCCNDNFADALCQEFIKNGINMQKDDTGIFTDSANFIGIIENCTNISVGYFNEHSTQEYQNISYLEKISQACLKINWEKLS